MQVIDHPSLPQPLAEVIHVEVCPACDRIARVLDNGEIAVHYDPHSEWGDPCEGSGVGPVEEEEDEWPEF